MIPLRFLLPLSLVLASGPALAHAIVIESKPKAGTETPAGPLEIELRYNSRIDAKHSTLSLIDEHKAATAVALDATDEPDRLIAHLAAIKPGQYRLRWQVLALDGHITRGDVPFTVLAP